MAGFKKKKKRQPKGEEKGTQEFKKGKRKRQCLPWGFNGEEIVVAFLQSLVYPSFQISDRPRKEHTDLCAGKKRWNSWGADFISTGPPLW